MVRIHPISSPGRVGFSKERAQGTVLYVIILSAALDLVPNSTPKGVVAFFNVFPALLAKVVWPYVSTGKIRYTRRVLFCAACSWLGLAVGLLIIDLTL